MEENKPDSVNNPQKRIAVTIYLEHELLRVSSGLPVTIDSE